MRDLSLIPWVRDWKHTARKGHRPEWYQLGPLMACLRCVKGGHRAPLLRLAPLPL